MGKKEERTEDILGSDVRKWIAEKGIEGAKAEMCQMADEFDKFVELADSIFKKHKECVGYHGLTFEMKVVAHCDTITMDVCEASLGVARYLKKEKQDRCNCGKFGGSCENDDCKEAVSNMIDSLDPEAKMMLAVLAMMGGIKK